MNRKTFQINTTLLPTLVPLEDALAPKDPRFLELNRTAHNRTGYASQDPRQRRGCPYPRGDGQLARGELTSTDRSRGSQKTGPTAGTYEQHGHPRPDLQAGVPENPVLSVEWRVDKTLEAC